MSETTLPMLPPTVATVASANIPRIIKGNELAMLRLKKIQEMTITSDEQREAAVADLTTVKAITDKMDLLVKETVGPLEDFIDQVKSYKKSIDYASKTKDGNEYSRARAVIEAYDQAKAKAAEQARIKAEYEKKVNLYKSEIKEGVGRRFVEMMAGQKKNIIDGLAKWEGALTLTNLEASYEKLQSQKPSLKQDRYESCFGLDFASPNKGLLNPEETKAYMDELRKEFPYEKFNKEYIEAVAPIINEYRARKDQVKRHLEEIQKADEANRIALEEKRKADLQAKAEAERAAVEKEKEEGMEKVTHEREMDKMNAEFTEQMQTQDLESGPMKREASFEDAKNYLKPFAEVIGACALNPKFPGIMKKNGTDYVDHVQWWLDWFAANCNQPVKGVVIKEVPKTIIRKK